MRFLTNVADHDTGKVIWSAPGKSGQTLQEFFDLLGERKDSIRRIDIGPGYERAVLGRYRAPRSALTPSSDRCRRPHSRPGPPRSVKRERQVQDPGSVLDQARPLGARQGAREPHRPPAARARPEPADQPPALPRLPPQRATTPPLPPHRPRRRRPPRRMARLGQPLQTQSVHPPGTNTSLLPRRHPRRHPTRPKQRPARTAAQQNPTPLPPQLRIALTPRPHRPHPTPHRPHLPLLRRHHHHPTAHMSHSNERRTQSSTTPSW